MEVHLKGRKKKRYLTEPPLDPMTDGWERGCACFSSQILNSLEQKVQDVAMHTSIEKEIWECLEELYSGSNNLNMVYDVV